MKNIIIILALISILSCKAQIIPVEDYTTYDDDIPNGAYIKDINNLFDKYIGFWTGTYNNKNYEFFVSKHTVSFLGITEDKLIIKYKIIDSSGNIIVNTLNVSNDSLDVINGDYLDINGVAYHLNYMGEDHMCGQNGYVIITPTNGDTQMHFAYAIKGEMHLEACPNGQVEQVLPPYILLTKQ